MATVEGQTVELRMFFSGLMVFARREREKDVHAILVDTEVSPRIPQTEGMPRHVPVVQFAWDEAVGDRKPFGSFEDVFGQRKGYWMLDKDVLTLDPGMETVESSLSFHFDEVGDQATPVEGNRQSFNWLSPLTDKDGKPGELRQGLVPPQADAPAAEYLAASVHLTRGALQPAAFASELGQFISLRFPDDKEHAVASVLEYRVKVKGRRVRLVAKKFDGSPGEVLELLPTNGGDDPTVEVWILNREWENIEKQILARPVVLGQQNPEYLFFFNLLEYPPDPGKLPRNNERVTGAISPNVSPCDDPAMRRLYFPTGGGETTFAAPCSPSRTP